MSNEIIKKEERKDIKSLLANVDIQKRFNEILGRRANQFISSIISSVNTNKKLAECVPMTVIQAALQAAILDLPIEQNFGFAYLIPYKNNKANIIECQFQMGYKGYIQLALRTGLYKRLNVMDIREGELKSYNPLTEELDIDFIKDEKERLATPVIGYAGHFSLLNGFEKNVFWSLDQLLAHGMKYSQEFKKFKKGMWVDQQDDMCRKTVIKDMIKKWGILSVEMQQPNMQLLEAIQADQAVIRGDGNYDYIDNVIDGEVVDEETGEITGNKTEENLLGDVDPADLPFK